MFYATLTVLGIALSTSSAAPRLDLADAVIVLPEGSARVERKAAAMLSEEVERRTLVRWRIVAESPAEAKTVVVLGTAPILKEFMARTGKQFGPQRSESEGYRIWIERGPQTVVWVSGNDPRGVLFGAGRLLRSLDYGPRKATIAGDLQIETSPQKRLRGHQLGYRPKCNSYDGWNVAMWEQYIRDLAVFGCNAIELIPPRSDDADSSPHFPLPKMEMMIEMSRLADEYGLDVWIWYPAMDPDYADAKTVEFALKEWGGVFARLPRIDAVFVPGGDPGHTRPKPLLDLLEKQTASLRRWHPNAQMWVSPQSFDAVWLEEFIALVNKEPEWLSGIVHGPQVRVSLPELRRRVPARYPLRDYPDITHSRHCQYPVPNWDTAFAMTEGREPINPRPEAIAAIYRKLHRNTAGFITYSEGCNDDVNKTIWSALGWDDNADVDQVMREYGRYFLNSRTGDRFAQGLLMLEKNWQGPLRLNTGVDETLKVFKKIERSLQAGEETNWRWQMALYRACYDAFLRQRLRVETDRESQALRHLANAAKTGSLEAMARAERALDGELPREARELRTRVFDLAEDLYKSIRMQLSVQKYQAIALERGANLDAIDNPLNSRLWLEKRFSQIRSLPTEDERRKQITEIALRTRPAPGGFYDDLGNAERQPHLVHGAGTETDPGGYRSAFTSFIREPKPERPVAWWNWAESLYDERLRMRYTGLKPGVPYKVRVVYAQESRTTRVRLRANDQILLHPYLNRPFEPLEFEIPLAATQNGNLVLSWNQAPGNAGNGRGCAVAEVWLEPVTP